MAGLLSKGIKLGYKATSSASTYTDLANLQEVPDLGQTPEQVDTTTLADSNKTSIPGLIDFGSLEFTFLYDPTIFNTLKGMEDTLYYWCIELPDATSASGTGSTFTFSGYPTVVLSGAGVNAALQFKLALTVNSDITFTVAS